jgi:hypothetical protein
MLLYVLFFFAAHMRRAWLYQLNPSVTVAPMSSSMGKEKKRKEKKKRLAWAQSNKSGYLTFTCTDPSYFFTGRAISPTGGAEYQPHVACAPSQPSSLSCGSWAHSGSSPQRSQRPTDFSTVAPARDGHKFLPSSFHPPPSSPPPVTPPRGKFKSEKVVRLPLWLPSRDVNPQPEGVRRYSRKPHGVILGP